MAGVRVVAIVGGIAAVALLLGGLGLIYELRPDSPPADVGVEQLQAGMGPVHVVGTAHWLLFAEQSLPPNLASEGRTYFVYPLFPPHDTANRSVHVLVRTPERPAGSTPFAGIVVEGRPTLASAVTLPDETRLLFQQQGGYSFEEDVVILEGRIVGTWQGDPPVMGGAHTEGGS